MIPATRSVRLTVNGRDTGPVEVPEDLMLLEFLQEYLNLTGTRYGCGQGVCRACTVILDRPDGRSRAVPSCVTGVAHLDGARVRTVEGHASRNEDGSLALSAIQQAYLTPFHQPGALARIQPGRVHRRRRDRPGAGQQRHRHHCYDHDNDQGKRPQNQPPPHDPSSRLPAGRSVVSPGVDRITSRTAAR